MNTNHSQNLVILKALLRGETLTGLEALQRFQSFRLPARIADIRAGKVDGNKYDKDTLVSERIRVDGKFVARYRIRSPRLRIIEAIPAFPTAKVENQQQLF